MIYITGDMHGNFSRFTKKRRSQLPFELSENDYVIVCGDFGLCKFDDAEFKYNCEWLGRLPFKILFVDGNHENFSMLNGYPVELWNGGKVHHIVKNKVIHLMRGQVFHIEEYKCFTFGGASSQDIQGGILDRRDPYYNDKRKLAIRQGVPYRIIGYSWWREELPDQKELLEGVTNLEKVDYEVDYIISHCGSNRLQYKLCQCQMKSVDLKYSRNFLTDYFDELEEKVQYKQWFCGHYHIQDRVDKKHTVLYERIIPINSVLD